MKIVLIGAGNVATNLGMALKKEGHQILQVYSRSESAAKKLAAALKSVYTVTSGTILPKADLYIISITDHAIKNFLKTFPLKSKIVVHTSGSTPVKVFGNKFRNCGVLYPLQTFSKERKLDFRDIPLLIEGSNPKTRAAIKALAESSSPFVFEVDSKDRKVIHLAAVFANNFTNHLFVLAEKILNRNDLPFHLLGPLISETVNKAMKLSPPEAQTGPAKRGDSAIMEEHLKMLSYDRKLAAIYQTLSESIERESGVSL